MQSTQRGDSRHEGKGNTLWNLHNGHGEAANHFIVQGAGIRSIKSKGVGEKVHGEGGSAHDGIFGNGRFVSYKASGECEELGDEGEEGIAGSRGVGGGCGAYVVFGGGLGGCFVGCAHGAVGVKKVRGESESI